LLIHGKEENPSHCRKEKKPFDICRKKRKRQSCSERPTGRVPGSKKKEWFSKGGKKGGTPTVRKKEIDFNTTQEKGKGSNTPSRYPCLDGITHKGKKRTGSTRPGSRTRIRATTPTDEDEKKKVNDSFFGRRRERDAQRQDGVFGVRMSKWRES